MKASTDSMAAAAAGAVTDAAAATAAAAPPKQKVVVITGTTGVGKTRLSVDIARRFNGEIVNSDAMQMYTQLDVATAKVTEAEKQGVPHRLFSFLEPTQQYTVAQYQKAAREAIADIAARGKVPVVVGGTMFYVEAILWNSLFDQATVAAVTASGGSGGGGKEAGLRPAAAAAGASTSAPQKRKANNTLLAGCGGDGGGDGGGGDSGSDVEERARALPEALTVEEKQELWEQLRAVDPVSANRIHPNNTRRVARSLEVYRATGRPHSEVIAEHRRRKDVQELQYDTHVVWLHCEAEALDRRLDARVDAMRDQGLLDEVRRLWEATIGTATTEQQQQQKGCDGDDAAGSGGGAGPSAAELLSQRGVLKSIGFKEFSEYFAMVAAENRQQQQQQPPKQEREAQQQATKHKRGGKARRSRAAPPSAAVLEECIAKLKQSTRQYARKQVRWIRNRVVARGVPVYRYETHDVERWAETVAAPALAGVGAWLGGDRPDAAALVPAPLGGGAGRAAAGAGGGRGGGGADVLSSCEAEKVFWESRDPEAWQRFHCEVCNRTLDGAHEWEAHQKSRRHRKQKAFLERPLHPKDKRRRRQGCGSGGGDGGNAAPPPGAAAR